MKGVFEWNMTESLYRARTWGIVDTFIYEHEAEVVPRRVFLVDFAEGRGEVETAEEEAYRDCFAARGGTIHYLKR